MTDERRAAFQLNHAVRVIQVSPLTYWRCGGVDVQQLAVNRIR